MKKYAVIVAGGSGSRMGGNIPKQFMNLNGHPVLWWSIKAFHEQDPLTDIIVVLPQDFISLWNDTISSLPERESFPHFIAVGGKSRTESVKNGLELIDEEDSLVAIHDGARPLISTSIISTGWQVAEDKQTAIPVVPVTDSLRCIEESPSRAVNRDNFVAVQTPQIFSTKLLKDAYRKAGDTVFTDDASVVENFGTVVNLFEGSPDNIKVTTPKDMYIAEMLLGKNA